MYPVVTEPNTVLRDRAQEVDLAILKEPSTQEYIERLIKTMYKSKGIGIASPQVGRSIRLVVIGKDALRETQNRSQFMLNQDLVLVNPVITSLGKQTALLNEGCLSVPKVYGNVQRHLSLTVEGFDRYGNPLSFSATDFLAHVVQHEIDHLEGTLFIDKATSLTTVE